MSYEAFDRLYGLYRQNFVKSDHEHVKVGTRSETLRNAQKRLETVLRSEAAVWVLQSGKGHIDWDAKSETGYVGLSNQVRFSAVSEPFTSVS